MLNTLMPYGYAHLYLNFLLNTCDMCYMYCRAAILQIEQVIYKSEVKSLSTDVDVTEPVSLAVPDATLFTTSESDAKVKYSTENASPDVTVEENVGDMDTSAPTTVAAVASPTTRDESMTSDDTMPAPSATPSSGGEINVS